MTGTEQPQAALNPLVYLLKQGGCGDAQGEVGKSVTLPHEQSLAANVPPASFQPVGTRGLLLQGRDAVTDSLKWISSSPLSSTTAKIIWPS